jgi:hypothetical protein
MMNPDDLRSRYEEFCSIFSWFRIGVMSASFSISLKLRSMGGESFLFLAYFDKRWVGVKKKCKGQSRQDPKKDMWTR